MKSVAFVVMYGELFPNPIQNSVMKYAINDTCIWTNHINHCESETM